MLTHLFRNPYSCVMDLGVAEYADQRGISERRVLQLIKAGDVKARRSGGRWLIEAQEINKRPQLSRPMGRKLAWALIAFLSNLPWQNELDPVERSRLKEHISLLLKHDHPDWLLSSWLRKRGDVLRVRANPADLSKLQKDDRIILSGISDPRSGISQSALVEGYIEQKKVKQFQRDHLLVSSSSPNVILRIVDQPIERPVPLGLVLADLADHFGPRESSQVGRLLRAI